MKKIIVFGASSSKTSINKQLATYAGSLLNEVEVKVLDLNDYTLPIYSIDVEAEEGVTEDATKFSADLQSADGYIVSLAEHNGTYTTAFKNAYDWASRVQKKVWGDKPMLLLSTSPGERGGASVFAAAKNGFPYMGAKLVGEFSLPSFYDTFKQDKVIDELLREKLGNEVVKLQQSLKL